MGLVGAAVEWAQETLGPYGVWGLVILAVPEAIFSPIPPDILLPVLAAAPDATWEYALFLGVVTTVASAGGAVIGYFIGIRFSPWVHRRFAGPRLAQVDAWYKRYGAWAVLIAAFTPIPYKVFTVSSGLLRMRLAPFILASIVGRGARFVPEALLAQRYGPQAIEWLDAGGLVVLAITLAIGVVLFVAYRMRSARTRAPE